MRTRKAYSPSEHDIQASFNAWFQQRYAKKGVLGFAIENAQNVHHGIGSVMKRRARGVTKGVADYFIAKPAGGFCGLFLEFKTEFGRVQPSQKQFGELVMVAGFCWEVVRSFEQARDVVEKYLSGELREVEE